MAEDEADEEQLPDPDIVLRSRPVGRRRIHPGGRLAAGSADT